MDKLIDAFECDDVRTIPGDRFEVYQKGWEVQIGTALVDAVYSKQTRYKTKRGRGLLPRLLACQEIRPLAGTDLHELLELTEPELRDVLGNGVTNGRTKAPALLEAASGLVKLTVYTHEQYDHQNQAHRDAYLHVHGLGPVTRLQLEVPVESREEFATPSQQNLGQTPGLRKCELPRGFRTAELVDSSTLPVLAVDNHSGLRWAVGNRARSVGADCCKTPRYSG
jgi:hypothetical protein